MGRIDKRVFEHYLCYIYVLICRPYGRHKIRNLWSEKSGKEWDFYIKWAEYIWRQTGTKFKDWLLGVLECVSKLSFLNDKTKSLNRLVLYYEAFSIKTYYSPLNALNVLWLTYSHSICAIWKISSLSVFEKHLNLFYEKNI